MPNAAEMFIELVDKIAPDFVPECVKATGKPQALSIYPELLERWRRDFDALAKLGTKEAVAILIEVLKDKNSEVRWEAAYALDNIGASVAIPYLIPFLKDKNSEVRMRAVEALGKIGTPEAIPYLIPLLKDEDFRVLEKAAQALGKISLKFFNEVEQALLPALNKDPGIGEKVFRALKEMGIRNPEAWVHYRNQDTLPRFSYFSRLPKNLLTLSATYCCQPEALKEALAILDNDGNILSIHTLDCDQVKPAYWQG